MSGAAETRISAAEIVDIAVLKPHPRNYQRHPDDQLTHIVESLRANGLYRNIVAARDWTILAGHGVVEAARKLGWTRISVVRLDLAPDDPRALRVLVGDNEVSHLAERDDRLLSELLREVKTSSDGAVDALLGTGYDDMMLANLVFVTRPKTEIEDFNAARAWAGLPAFDEGDPSLKITVTFRDEAAREEFAARLGLKIIKKEARNWSAWWPSKERDDSASVRFVAGGEPGA